MKVWIKNETTLQNEQVEIKEDGWAWANAAVLAGFVFALAAGSMFLLFR